MAYASKQGVFNEVHTAIDSLEQSAPSKCQMFMSND